MNRPARFALLIARDVGLFLAGITLCVGITLFAKWLGAAMGAVPVYQTEAGLFVVIFTGIALITLYYWAIHPWLKARWEQAGEKSS